ncbi:MAG: hypothetical protein Q8N35_17825 [Methylococcaceae bacterium]|nr:hypothetical protein [Methylococcaceae bacterium]MDZ4155156.1 hypothetical protein [Methylococcales bacterium]MDP2394400.1 hypothetical protein [Methylococcaceae bacterium]MDP3021443.1 hypothetical protein [Methylococcaceae bacterium]MDP3388583.1 hypothetical protein [Methylococcaceae bacterium]
MQVQDYLPFFQSLALKYYQFTLENPAYAACLAAAVWLLTTIFYSIRIGFLNGRNRRNIKALIDTQTALAAAELQIQQLQAELTAANEQLEQSKAESEQLANRSTALQSRLSWFDNQLSESIGSLTTNADLSEQFSPNASGLETEDLWQRYSAINKQLSANLAAERKTNNELQQAFKVETAKLAEKDQQLQLLQIHVDSQSQQLAQLELTVAEHKNQLTQQEASAQQRISESEAKHQADLARLNALEQQAVDLTQANQQQAQLRETLSAQNAVISQLEEAKAVEIKAVEPQAVFLAPEPQQQAPSEPTISSVQEAVISKVEPPEPTIIVAETPKPQAIKAPETDTAGVGGKFKSFFSSAKQKIDKLDGKLVEQHIHTAPEAPAQIEQITAEPQVLAAETPVIAQPVVANVNYQPETAVKEAVVAPAPEQTNSFAPKAWSDETTLTLSGRPPQAATPKVEAQAAKAPASAIDSDNKPTSKLKNLFSKFKRKS